MPDLQTPTMPKDAKHFIHPLEESVSTSDPSGMLGREAPKVVFPHALGIIHGISEFTSSGLLGSSKS